MPKRSWLKNGDLAEDAFSEQVRQLFELYDWTSYHTHRSQYSAAGFPDWIAFRTDPDGHTRAIAAELKAEHGTFSDLQLGFLTFFGDMPVWEVWAWWPHDLDLIAEVLR